MNKLIYRSLYQDTANDISGELPYYDVMFVRRTDSYRRYGLRISITELKW